MLNDKNENVRIQAVTSLGKARAISALIHLNKLVHDSNSKIRKAAIRALGEIASSSSIDLLKQTVLNAEERITTRIAAINGLGKIGTEEVVTGLLEVLDKTNEHYHYKAVIALGKIRSKQALPELLSMLEIQEKRRTQWRKIRDENIDGYSDEQIEGWRKRLEAVKPQTYMEFELAHAIAMIDPAGKGLELLAHDLAKVREGAWSGLAKPRLTDKRPYALADSPAAVARLEDLIAQRQDSGDPLFRHAAYRAIDGMLITLETYGRDVDLAALEILANQPPVREQPAVLTRVDWTIARLQQRKEMQQHSKLIHRLRRLSQMVLVALFS